MTNELLLVLSLCGVYLLVLLWYALFGESGLIGWTVFATIAANIEVMLLVDAFGMAQTLGNVLFASTFLVTDILSEVAGKKAAGRAVNIGILTSASFILVSQSWLLYRPNAEDVIAPSIRAVFSNTPRLMLTGLLVYAVVQRFDVFLYHAWWRFTERRFGGTRPYLWLRNNGSTLVSQLLNTVLFTLGAFWGVFEPGELLTVMLSSYVIFIVTSLADTPVVYLARRIHEKRGNAEKAPS
ncbi:MAG: queuosine precursor transporter [Oscillospiraceae bacterium]|jgi:uncharacterized integral membrane protein (TIGR00697 family)|nr:queuosine precursor transporter [Oscillospiraceae bacterium]